MVKQTLQRISQAAPAPVKRSAKQAARVGTVLTVAALSLGSAGGGAAQQPFIAKAHSLTPAPVPAAAAAAVVETQVVSEAPPVLQQGPVTDVQPRKAAAPRGACGLDYIKSKESGGNYGAVSPSGKYRGAYQFDQRTWQSVGGSGDPAAASPAEQDSRAAALYAKRGSQPWGVCGFR